MALEPNCRVAAQAAAAAPWKVSMAQRGIAGLTWKAMMKVTRYRARGATHRKGADATSVARWAVTPSIRLDGMAARATQIARSRQVGVGVTLAGAALDSPTAISDRFQTITAREAGIST